MSSGQAKVIQFNSQLSLSIGATHHQSWPEREFTSSMILNVLTLSHANYTGTCEHAHETHEAAAAQQCAHHRCLHETDNDTEDKSKELMTLSFRHGM